jgi:hypothetical protein
MDIKEVTTPEVIETKIKRKYKKKAIPKKAFDETISATSTTDRDSVPASQGATGTGKKKPKGLAGIEIGDSGTQNLDGIITEEYNTKLAGIQGIKVYDEMRKSDGTVRAVVLVTTLPIRRAEWRIEPFDSESEEDVKIAEFVEKNLFEYMDITWNDFLRQALLMLPLGVMVFEKVYGLQVIEGQTYIVIKNLAPRLPKTIYRWQQGNKEEGIQQQKQDGELVDIPMEKLLVFVNEMEGENWWGTSILRAAYKHWFIKNNLYKIDAIGIERQALGIPFAKLPEAYTEADKVQAAKILQNIRANEAAYIIEPPGYEIGFKDMMAHTVRDPEPTIVHHNREITKAVLAQFLELGASGKASSGGSRALSEDHSELFLLALEAIADAFKDIINKKLIKELVRLNFNTENFPLLEYNGIKKTDVVGISSAYASLKTAGAITALEKDEMFFRDLLGLPAVSIEELDEAKENALEKQQEIMKDMNPKDKGGDNSKDKTDKKDVNKEDPDEVVDDMNMSESFKKFKKKEAFDLIKIEKSLSEKLSTLDQTEQLQFLNQQLYRIEGLNEYKKFFTEVREILQSKKNSLVRQRYSETNDFKGWRELTFAEKKVNLNSIQDFFSKMEDRFKGEAKEHFAKVQEQYVKQLSKLILAGDISGIQELELKLQNGYKDIIKTIMKDSFVFGKNNVSIEMGINAPANPNDLMSILELTADNIARSNYEDLLGAAKKVVTEQVPKGKTAIQVAALVEQALVETIDRVISSTGSIVVGGSINQGRNVAIEYNKDNVHALQRSEILDFRTCNYCLSVDNRIIDVNDPFGKNTIFHGSCRGIWVEILKDESVLPKITGVPTTLRDKFGDSVNELEQPKKPLVKKDSLASKFLNGN